MLERLSWEEHLAAWDWRQGEHVSIVGPTGLGKTTVALALLPLRDYVAVLASKPRDVLLAKAARLGYERIGEWPPPVWADRVILWPKLPRRTDALELVEAACDEQRRALQDIYRDGNWTVYLDESIFTVKTCGLGKRLELLWLQGRSLGVALVVSAQRPVHLPPEAWSQATHLYASSTRDRRDLERIAEISGRPRKEMLELMEGISGYQMLYTSRDGRAWVTQAPDPHRRRPPTPTAGHNADDSPDRKPGVLVRLLGY